MTSATALNALADRVEQGSGEDRELDAQVWLALTPGATRKALHIDHPKGAYTIDETRDASRRLIIVPSYTTDLTAVMPLIERVVPAGTNWKLHGTTGDGAAASAHLMQQSGYAWSPERALTAALLRAAAAQIGEG